MPDPSKQTILTPDLNMARQFLTHIAEDESVTFQTLDDGPNENPQLNRIFHGDFEDHHGPLTAYNQAGAGVYFTVNATDGKGRKVANITRVRAVFVDLDGSPLEPVLNGPLPPHIITETSLGRWHCYWRVDGIELAEFTPIQKELAKKFGGDPSVCDLPRLMRLPGFHHRKREPFLTHVIGSDGGLPYSRDEFLKAFPIDIKPAASEDFTTSDRLNAASILQGVPEGERDDTLFKYGCRLRGKGLDLSEAAALIFLAADNCKPPFPREQASIKLKQAWQYEEPVPIWEPKKSTFDNAEPPDIYNPPGILSEMVNYYNRTARKPQPFFAIQTALALCSVVAARQYRTTKSNFSSLYFMLIGKSGEGKEHSRDIVNRCLTEADLSGKFKGNSYTSSGGIFSALLQNPAHICALDEFGRYLASSKSGGNSNQTDAMTTLISAFGCCHSSIDPQSYSTMCLTKKQAEDINSRTIFNPGISLLALSQPQILFDAMASSNVSDGFLGRFLYVESDGDRRKGRDPDHEDPPLALTAWIKAISCRRDGEGEGNLFCVLNDDATSKPTLNVLSFDSEAMEELGRFEDDIILWQNELDKIGIPEILARTKEKAMRISLILALSRDPNSMEITADDVRWSIAYAKWCDFTMLTQVRKHLAGSKFEAMKKAILNVVREKGKDGLSIKDMIRRSPISEFIPRDRDSAINDLVTANLIAESVTRTGKPGQPKKVYTSVRC